MYMYLICVYMLKINATVFALRLHFFYFFYLICATNGRRL